MWKKFAETGGADKDRMVHVCNWLLSFSVAIIGVAFAKGVDPSIVTKGAAIAILGGLGLLLSIASALVTIIYGGYANWNWAKADQIARVYHWDILKPKDEPWTAMQKLQDSCLLAKWGRCWSAPADTYSRLAPIFNLYFVLALLSAFVHIIIMGMACWV